MKKNFNLLINAFLLFLAIVSLSVASYGQKWNDKYGLPIVTLIETDPWLWIIGSDVPTIAIYEHGDVIYKRLENKETKYFSVNLDSVELHSLISNLGFSDSLFRMAPKIEASEATDQPNNILITYFDSMSVKQVYGYLRSETNSDREKTPSCFLKVFDNLIKYRSNSEKEWVPDLIEIMASDYGRKSDDAIQ